MVSRNTDDNRRYSIVAIDFLMVILLLINLGLISFDWLYTTFRLDDWLAARAPGFAALYDEWVHQRFLTIDLVFVTIFLAEFFFSWAVAVVQRQHSKWFFYPFLHWYDLLGCIPLSAFRVVRLLRVFTIIYRLQRLGVIHLERTALYRTANKYYAVVLEEISDRVVENIIDEMQAEVSHAGPTIDSIVRDVLRPRRPVIVDWFSKQLSRAVNANFARNRTDIRAYVEQAIAESFRKNGEIKQIEQIPIAGKAISGTLERSIANIVYNIIEKAAEDLASPRNRVLVTELAEVAFHAVEDKESAAFQAMLIDVLKEVLESIKKQVAHTRRWQLEELAERLETAKPET